ncbi:MAG: methyltransferase domain-containing protein [Gemmatimonadota bacterium]|nr:methyltransferase domain-containing protein [Gemmatimonadota bacterium]
MRSSDPSAKPGSHTRATTRYWDAVGAEWQRSRPSSLWREHSDAINRSLVERWLPASGLRRSLKTDAFDEAVGVGIAPGLAERAGAVVSIDLAISTLRAATRDAPTSGVVADVRALPFSEESFDAVVSNSTLDHFEDDADIDVSLSELARVMTPRGRLVVTMDNPQNPIVSLRNILPFEWLHRIGLVPYRYGATTDRFRLRERLESAGFAVERIETVLHCPRVLAIPLASWAERALGPSGRARLRGALGAFERLATWPSRFRTAHFIVALAERR